MKIISTNTNNEIVMGIGASLTALDHQFLFWDRTKKSAFDMFDEVNPDIVICQGIDIDPTLTTALKEFNNAKLILFGMGVPEDVKPSLLCYPNEFTPEQIELINYNNHPYIQIAKAANLAKFHGGVSNPQDTSDVLYYSDSQYGYQSILGMIANLTGLPYKVKLFGPVFLPFAEYVGNAALPTTNNVIVSTKLAIDFFHTHIYDYAINKICCLSAEPSDIGFPHFTPKTFDSNVEELLANTALSNEYVRRAYTHVRYNHTYFHRVSDIFNKLGYTELADESRAKVGELLND